MSGPVVVVLDMATDMHIHSRDMDIDVLMWLA